MYIFEGLIGGLDNIDKVPRGIHNGHNISKKKGVYERV